MTRTIISPHLDDAVLSLGQFIQTDHAMVITVFAGAPEKGTLSDYDRDTGFDDSARAIQYRRQEDQRAMELVGATPVHWNYLDRQYLEPPNRKQMRNDLAQALRNGGAYVPLGIGHPDHRLVARECRNATTTFAHVTLFLYEELPYRVEHPEQVAEMLQEVRDEGWSLTPHHPQPGGAEPLLVKCKAIAAYKSQFPHGAEDPQLHVPERVWKAQR